jgi:hypothetical protein
VLPRTSRRKRPIADDPFIDLRLSGPIICPIPLDKVPRACAMALGGITLPKGQWLMLR